MVKKNSCRSGCVDVFRSHLVADAIYAGDLEMPVLSTARITPNRIVPFSQALSKKDRGLWVHFYEDDSKFERVWNNPNRYLKVLSEFDGVISPDFSVYRDMPLVMQYWNIYRSRAIAHALQSLGCSVVPNLRFGDRRTWDVCCLGIPTHSVVSVGSHGNLRDIDDRRHFTAGLEYIVDSFKPYAIVVYGTAPDAIFGKYSDEGIEIIAFDSAFAISRKERL